MAKRFNNIAFLKTIMMILVVLGHSLIFFGGSWFTAIEPAEKVGYMYVIARWMSTFHIQIFTMSSGFLFYYLKTQDGRYKDFKGEIKKRAKRLLIPYLFASVLWAIPVDCLFSFKSSSNEIIHRYLFMSDPSQLWFLIMLFLVFVFFIVFSDKIKVSFKGLLIMLVLTTGLSHLASFFNIQVFQLPKTFQFILYFYLGGFVFQNKGKITRKQGVIMAVLSVVLYVCILLFNMSSMKLLQYTTIVLNPVLSILESGCIYYFCTALIKQGKINISSRFYELLERNSFGIYLFHQQLVYIAVFLLNGLVHPIVLVLFSFVFSLMLSMAMSLLLGRFKITRFMFGLQKTEKHDLISINDRTK